MAAAHARVAGLTPRRAALERTAADRGPAPAFADALRRPNVAVIAEVKRRSPSKGDLAPGIRAGERASSYAAGGAAAISVLTEPSRFAGSMDDLREVADAVSVPVLRKDFIVHELQIVEARAAGAAAVLLIARALEPAALRALVASSRSYGVEPLVEVRTATELGRAVDCGARVIGVNARDLETLMMDGELIAQLIGQVPRDAVAVAESGMTDRASVEAAARAGADAVLVGSVLSLATDPQAAVRDLAGVPRTGR